MQCSEIREMLSSYIDNVLSHEDHSRVEGHINICSACRQELEDLQETIRLIRSLGEVAPPDNFRKQLMPKIRKEPLPSAKALKSRIPGMKGWFGGTWRYAAAAIIILGIGIGAGIYKVNQPEMYPYGDIVGKSKALNDTVSEYNMASAPEAAKNENLYQAPHTDQKAADQSGADSLKAYRVQREAKQKESSTDKYVALTPGRGTVTGRAQTGDTGELNKAAAISGAVPEGAAAKGLVENQDNAKKVQKIIKEANLSIEVEKYKEFSSRLLTVTEQYGGYIENSSENLDSAVSANFVIRVPNEQFSYLIGAVEKLGKINAKQVSGRDVTGEFVDTESRMRNFQAQEERLLGLIDKAQDLGDVVTLENELSRVRGEIETLQGRLKVLDDTVVYSTIRLDVTQSQKPEVTPPQGTLGKAVNNFRNSCIALINFAGNIVTFAGWILPWVLFVGGTGGSVVYYRRTKKKTE